MGRFDEGVAELRWFVSRHPDDAVGHFELGSAENKDNPAQALAEFDRALALKADFAAAHAARGGLYYQMGKPEAALPDLEAAAALRPDDAVSLDRLGQTYLALDRTDDAVRVLRQAGALAPDDSKTQLHLARALADAGQTAESKAAMERFRQLGPPVNKAVPGGLVDYLGLTPEQRRTDYRARVERVAREHPEDPAGQVTYLRLLLEEGESTQAAEIARRIVALKPPSAVLAEAGGALVEARMYAPAQELLKTAFVSGSAHSPELDLDLAIAAFHASGPADGMRLLDGVPESSRTGSYYLAKAEMLDAAGRKSEAAAAIDRATRTSPKEAEPYLQTCLFLMRKGQSKDALRVSGEALQALPQNRRILLLRAIVLEAGGLTGESQSLLRQVEARWPEWASAWAAEGIILGSHGRSQDARAPLQTAIALGIDSPEVKRYLDEISKDALANPADLTLVLLAQLSKGQ